MTRVTCPRSKQGLRPGGWRLTLLCLYWSILSVAALAYTDTVILSNTEQGVTVRYHPSLVSWRSLNTDTRLYNTPTMQGASLPWPAGAPQLPQRVLWLVIPPGKNAQIQSVTPYALTSTTNVPAPVPTLIPTQNGPPAPEFQEDPQYYSAGAPFPASWAQLTPRSSYRNLHVVRLLLYPFRFPSNSGGIFSCDSLDIRIQFTGQGIQTAPTYRPDEDQFYSGFITNWQGSARNWKTQVGTPTYSLSAWPNGDLYKIEIGESGIYRLTYDDLIDAGIDLEGLNPRTLRLFNNGGQTLPKDPNASRPQELIENAIFFYGDEFDGSFDPGEEIWFFGQSVHDWKWNLAESRYRHYQNPYVDHNVYWLNVNPQGDYGRRMDLLSQTGSPSVLPDNTRGFICLEQELYAIYNDYDLPVSLPDFFGDSFTGATSRNYTINLEEVYPATTGGLIVRLRKGDTLQHSFELLVNNSVVYAGFIPQNSLYTTVNVTLNSGLLHAGNNIFRIEHNSSGVMYLDYYELHYIRSLTANSNTLEFISPEFTGLAGFQIQGMNDPYVFDVTEFDDVRYLHGDYFVDSSSSTQPKRYLSIEPNARLTPLAMQKDQPGDYGDLRQPHSADMIVLCADAFYSTMAEYESYREGASSPTNLEVLRVRVSDVFDEFGWGLVDPAAIRDFLKSTLSWPVSPLYVLFVGDGDFDYKNRLSNSDANWLIPYESNETCTDDWYTYLSASGSSAYPEMASGRWPAQTTTEVQTLINRLIQYETAPELGPWQNLVTFVADDEYGPNYSSSELEHVRDTENIAENIFPNYLDREKIYLTEYPGTVDPIFGGVWKPEANRDLVEAINEGRLLVNYMGHGNPSIWTHESVFQQTRDLPLLYNGAKLPLFVAATCDWAYWDNPFAQSMPEEMLTLPGGGAIAAIAATRLTYPNPNDLFAQNLYSNLFSQPGTIPLGNALMQAKTDLAIPDGLSQPQFNSNSEKYHLLGDPVMKLVVPQLLVVYEDSSADTLNALQPAFISGQVCTQSGALVSDFNGIARLQVFGAQVPVQYWCDETNPPVYLYYNLPGNLIFRGDCEVSAGRFQTSFVVPVDINYGGAAGRYSVLAYSNENDMAGVGANDSVFFGQSAATTQDTIPPTVNVYFGSSEFQSGDPIPPEATLIVAASDSNGINLTGAVGHGIVANIDGGNPLDLTDAFSYDMNSYTSGEARYTFTPGELPAGVHTVEVTVWDAANNPNSATTTFEALSAGDLKLTAVLNYPNPFNHSTQFTFWLTSAAEITIKVYTVSGKLVKAFSGWQAEENFNYSAPWEGRDEQGDLLSNGVYLYKVSARASDGRQTEEIGKLIILK